MKSTKIINTLALLFMIMFNSSLAQDNSIAQANSFLQKESKTALKESYGADWMKGSWIGHGYGCGGRSNIPEDINVEYVDGEFVAKKTTGDDCVPVPNVTFRGKLPDDFETGKSYQCTITLGSPAAPASSSSTNCRVVPLEKDKFKVDGWGLEFTRGSLNPQKEQPRNPPAPQPKGPAPVVVVDKPQPCNNDNLPEVDDDEDVYTKHIDVVEKFKRAKYPLYRGPDNLVLVPRKWFELLHKNPRPHNNPRKPSNDDDDDDDDYDDEPRRKRNCRRRK